jgi:L-aminopeptidase/D-esterase-like protein
VITDLPGLRVGHWTDADAATGCTVVLFPEGTVASAEVRGGAPATRELEVLDPGATVQRIDALLLTGGSAFGLAAADGVMRWCEEHGVGLPTTGGRVPIVVALALFDLGTGTADVRPGAASGYAACAAAGAGPVELGRVGAGTGATVGSRVPGGPRRPGGLVAAEAVAGDLWVAALVAVNAFGAPAADDASAPALASVEQKRGWATAGGNTTIGLVATNARLDKAGCHRVAQGAHDGLARSVFPAHTRFDGDAFVAASVGTAAHAPAPGSPSGSEAGLTFVEADVDAVRALAVHVVAAAIGSLGP